MQEIWLPVCHETFSDHYLVSNKGRVRSLHKSLGTVKNSSDGNEFISLINHSEGYKCVALSDNGMTKRFFVHRLVAEAFIPNPNNLPQVNHIDGNKQNNCVSNLEWCTARENIRHAIDTGLIPYGVRSPYKINNKLYFKENAKPVYKFTMDGKLIKKWRCALDASSSLGIPNNKIYMCCNNQISYTNGFLFSYTDFAKPVLSAPKSKNGLSKRKANNDVPKIRRTRRPISQYDLDGNLIAKFNDTKTASLQTGVSKTGISLCCSGKRKQSNGFVWKYADV